MKKHFTIFLTVAMIAMLFTGCGSTSSTAASSSSAPEAEKTETTEGSAQEEKNTEAAPNVEETEAAEDSALEEKNTEAASEQEEAGAAEDSKQDGANTAAQTGFRVLSLTVTDAEGRLASKTIYYENNDIASMIYKLGDDGYIGCVDREYDEEGKWIGAKTYSTQGITDIEGINLDDYRTEEYMTSTGVCKYDDNGFVVESSDLNGNLVLKTTYNSQGQAILAENYKDGEITSTSEFIYNEQGIPVKRVNKDEYFERLTEYTPFGVTFIETSYQDKRIETGDIERTRTMELHYDDNGILTDGEIIEKSGNGEIINTSTCTFVLDEYGNILNYSVFDKDGNFVAKYEIEIVPIYE
ncbi:MAG: hypothetical protein Q4D71_12580 [Oscillospiraceae bacterium]|nr:hypothetical protein [Oscillospiraceae bacterium]